MAARHKKVRKVARKKRAAKHERAAHELVRKVKRGGKKRAVKRVGKRKVSRSRKRK